MWKGDESLVGRAGCMLGQGVPGRTGRSCQAAKQWGRRSSGTKEYLVKLLRRKAGKDTPKTAQLGLSFRVPGSEEAKKNPSGEGLGFPWATESVEVS